MSGFRIQSGYFNGSNGNGYFDLQRDPGFGNYAIFSGTLDWRFKRKHHLLFSTASVVSTRTTTLNRTIEWQGKTFDLGVRTEASIKSLFFTPGCQYDFFRRRSGYLGVVANINLAYTDAKLKAATAGGAAAQGDGSIFAPLPAGGSILAGIRPRTQAALSQWNAGRHVFLRLREFRFRQRRAGISNLHSLGCACWLPDGEPSENHWLDRQYCGPPDPEGAGLRH